MIESKRYVVYESPKALILILFWVISSFGVLSAQQQADIGGIALPNPSSLSSQYTYDSESDRYIFFQEIGGYPIGTPLVLTIKEFEALVLNEQMQNYFKDKVQALSGRGSDLEDTQKNLLPELYVNNNFFQSIFGSNAIDISPQGSIGIDLGYRYQRNDNPITSPVNRRSPGFDFDQRISLSLLGKIGERLQITANYDTESTFDFQNLIKIQFNPPQLSELKDVIPGKIGSRINDVQGKVNAINDKIDNVKSTVQGVQNKIGEVKNTLNQARQKIDQLKNNINQLPNSTQQVGNRVSEYLKGKVTEDAILQNIDIGNISLPLNSNLIQGAQSLFGVRADLKFGNTTISGVFSEQRSQSQNITSQGGGKLQEFSLYALDYEEDRHYFISQYFRDNYDTFLSNYPYINSPVQINRIEVWVTNRGYQTQNVRNIIALQDLGEANPNNSKLDDSVSEFFFATNPKDPPSNNANKLDPDEIGFQEVRELTQNGMPLGWEVNGTVLKCMLAKPLLPGESTVFEMRWDAQVPKQIRRSGWNNKEGVEFTMTHWYPKLAEYDKDGGHPAQYVGREFYGVR